MFAEKSQGSQGFDSRVFISYTSLVRLNMSTSFYSNVTVASEVPSLKYAFASSRNMWVRDTLASSTISTAFTMGLLLYES